MDYQMIQMIGKTEAQKRSDRFKRGMIDDAYLETYLGYSSGDLLNLLNNSDPQKRTAAAIILGRRKKNKYISVLCDRFRIETALYSRIAISEALEEIGEPAVENLIELLGLIGKNHEKQLPIQYFKKKSFPLPRDLAARTLVKIGEPAVPQLISFIETQSNICILQQALDAIGGIAAKTGNSMALPFVINVLKTHSDNDIMLWKCIRTLGGFKNNLSASKLLINVLREDHQPPILWEALRSLGNIGIYNRDVASTIESFKNSSNSQIVLACDVAITHLQNYK